MRPVHSTRRQHGAVNLVVVLLIVLILVLLGTGGGLAYYLISSNGAPAAVASTDGAPAAAPAPQGKPIYMALEPPLIVNFDRNGRIGFVQASIQLMARNQAVIDGAKEHLPVVRNNLIMLFSGKNFQDLVGREAREALRIEALEEVNKLLSELGVAGRFEDLYFTGFVMQ